MADYTLDIKGLEAKDRQTYERWAYTQSAIKNALGRLRRLMNEKHPGVKLVITSLYRTQEENDALYHGERQFSWHIQGLAADIRTKNLDSTQRRDVLSFLKESGNFPEVWSKDEGDHIHIQIESGRRRDPNVLASQASLSTEDDAGDTPPIFYLFFN